MRSKHFNGFLKILVGFSLVILSLALISFSACSSSTPSSTSTTSKTTVAPAPSTSTSAPTSTTATSTPVSTGATFVFRMAPGGDNPPPTMGYTIAVTDFVNLIQQRTNGRVQIQPYWSQTLVAQNNIVSALQSGTANIAQMVPHVETGKLPLAMVGQQAGIGSDTWARISAFYDLCNQDPEKSELAKYNVKCIAAMGQTETYLISKNPIRSLADLKGKKIAASGGPAQVMSALGAVPVTMGPPDQYSGLDKGTIDGIASPLAAINDFKFYEVGKYFNYLPSGQRAIPIGMNMDDWNKLPADIQKVFIDSVPDIINSAYKAMAVTTDPVAIKEMQNKQIEFIKFSDADMAEVNKVLAGLADQWAAGLGDDGKKILSDYRALVDKYEKISPYKK
jgi:TRAP-type transport system periplasmic protein